MLIDAPISDVGNGHMYKNVAVCNTMAMNVVQRKMSVTCSQINTCTLEFMASKHFEGGLTT